ncbi:hypothetical protein GCM10010441_45330 [Kitasatospora paracochleata]|uniref:Ribosomal protein L24E n=1 Tax=Kitasatospora paracochleata TaxID=58354 RepID=A0ABT1JBQ7_9ACTN|nr:hypothetical protein [Kitasatospora paracochleata]MCP2314111.1 ribosomal protein L24E [Kitasatospora paracochleata]
MDDTGFEGQAGWAAELCDLCGAVIEDGGEVYFLVSDSSVVHRTDRKLDGKRMVVARGREHGRQLVEQCRARPFVELELWAGKIGRALDRRPEGLRKAELAEATGLTPVEIELGARWKAMSAVVWRAQFGTNGGGPPP